MAKIDFTAAKDKLTELSDRAVDAEEKELLLDCAVVMYQLGCLREDLIKLSSAQEMEDDDQTARKLMAILGLKAA